MVNEEPLIIDAHQHFWKYDAQEYAWISDELAPLKRDFLPEELLQLLNKEKISGAISVQARQSEKENEFLLNHAKGNPFIKGVVGWIDLRSEKVEERLSFYRNFPILKGFRHVVQDEKDPEFMLHPAFLQGIEQLIKYGYCYDILVYARQLPQVLAFLNHFPDKPFIIDHLAKPDIKQGGFTSWQADMRKIAAFPKVLIKVSGMITEADWHHWEKEDFYPYLDELVLSFGVERLCYGSDWPVCNLAGNYSMQWDIVKTYFSTFNPSDINKVMGWNTQRFYHLNEK
ncbi:MAG: amidohydrolase family protein [Bacteroidota bacterium]|jgi:L-fuconolactonase